MLARKRLTGLLARLSQPAWLSSFQSWSLPSRDDAPLMQPRGGPIGSLVVRIDVTMDNEASRLPWHHSNCGRALSVKWIEHVRHLSHGLHMGSSRELAHQGWSSAALHRSPGYSPGYSLAVYWHGTSNRCTQTARHGFSSSPINQGRKDGKIDAREQNLEAKSRSTDTLMGSGNNLANWISIARGISGPAIAYWIIEGAWTEALVGIVLAGFSDWLDGYIAKNWGQASVLGSYLDPLGDKIVVVSTVGSLAWVGVLPTWLACIILGRDVVLVGGAFFGRAQALQWRWASWGEFFRTSVVHRQPEVLSAAAVSPPAVDMQPVYISKVNTTLQFLLTSGYVLNELHGIPDVGVLSALGGVTALTTLASLAIYYRRFRAGMSCRRGQCTNP